MTREKRLPSLGVLLTILGLFVVIMFSFIVILKLPIQLALLAVWFMIMGFGLYLGYDYLEMEKGILKGIYEGMGAILILIAVGALIGFMDCRRRGADHDLLRTQHHQPEHLPDGGHDHMRRHRHIHRYLIRCCWNSGDCHDGHR